MTLHFRKNILSICFALLAFSSACPLEAQISLGVHASYGIQSMSVPSGIQYEGYIKPRILPQGGFTMRFPLGERTAARAGLSMDLHGFRLMQIDTLGQDWLVWGGAFAKLNLGVEYFFPVNDRLHLGASIDLAGGLPVRENYKEIRGDSVVYSQWGSPVLFGKYLGANIGLAVEYRLEKVRLRFCPTYQMQLYPGIQGTGDLYLLYGFAPRLEAIFPF